MMQNCLKTYRT